jgi:hypothetical protein
LSSDGTASLDFSELPISCEQGVEHLCSECPPQRHRKLRIPAEQLTLGSHVIGAPLDGVSLQKGLCELPGDASACEAVGAAFRTGTLVLESIEPELRGCVTDLDGEEPSAFAFALTPCP